MLVTWNRMETYNLLCAFEKLFTDENFIINDIMIKFIFLPFFSDSIKYNWNFRSDYLRNFKIIPNLIENYNFYPVNNWYSIKYRFKKPKARKILWLMYNFYNEVWFKKVKDISYENIWLRQIYENNLSDLNMIIFSRDYNKNIDLGLKEFIIPEIFVHNEKIYEIS